MFIGHYAAGFASKRLAPKAGLGPLMAAPLLLDLVWPVLVLTGYERVIIEPGNTAFTPLNFVYYPFTHSLLGAAVWALAFGLLYWAITKYVRGAVVIAAGVLSHWLFDAVVHRPDLPLYPGGPMAGAGLWRNVAATMLVEVAIFALGVVVYVASTRAKTRGGTVGLWAMVAFLLAVYVANVVSPPPPGAEAVAVAALAQCIFPLWAEWFDRRREVRIR